MPPPMPMADPGLDGSMMQHPPGPGHWENRPVWVPDPVEQVVHRHVPVVHEQTVEVPHIQYQERIVEVPHVQTQEVVRRVTVPIVQEREVQVPKIEYVERIVEVPHVQQRPVEQIIEVPVPQ